ncbi:keratin-associated protein 10-6-like [Plectropomus leopardus]|uniref:keratin-associated protein 10-6-like n=1 Tax=Plectropomus leopardus TaxID=160734 RepID=UPI001C4B294E|nr:keratin-associated protein 10-6-like [Plectropomus leopardus]
MSEVLAASPCDGDPCCLPLCQRSVLSEICAVSHYIEDPTAGDPRCQLLCQRSALTAAVSESCAVSCPFGDLRCLRPALLETCAVGDPRCWTSGRKPPCRRSALPALCQRSRQQEIRTASRCIRDPHFWRSALQPLCWRSTLLEIHTCSHCQ